MKTETMTEATQALILAGDGYQLTIAPDAEQAKAELLKSSAGVTVVSDNDESYRAQRAVRELAAMRIMVEKCRTEVKAPVLRVGKMIDTAAAEFLVQINAEEARLKKLIGDHAHQVAAEKARKEAEERRVAEEARRAREAAERAEAQRVAAEKERVGIAALLAARQAEQAANVERTEVLAQRMAIAEEVASTEVAQGVRFALDFDVVDAARVYAAAPALVELTVRRREALEWLKRLDGEGTDVVALGEEIGLRVTRKAVVSTR